jgi:hypothetical protein
VLGRRSGVWCLQSGDADHPEVAESVARSLVALFGRGVVRIAPRRACRTLPIDRNWLVEGLDTSQVVRFDVIADDQWPLVNAAMAVFEVHTALVAGDSELTTPFSVLIASGPDRLVAIDACWSDDGFLYLADRDSEAAPGAKGAWSDRATPDLASLVPDLDRLEPVVLHPLAAWALRDPIEALQTDEAAPCRNDWRELCEEAIRSGAPATLRPAGVED